MDVYVLLRPILCRRAHFTDFRDPIYNYTLIIHYLHNYTLMRTNDRVYEYVYEFVGTDDGIKIYYVI